MSYLENRTDSLKTILNKRKKVLDTEWDRKFKSNRKSNFYCREKKLHHTIIFINFEIK